MYTTPLSTLISSQSLNHHLYAYADDKQLFSKCDYVTFGYNGMAKLIRLFATSDQYLAIARKRLKIDGYRPRLLCFEPALNPLSIHVTFTAIVPGAYPGEAKMCKKCAKMANF